MESSAFFFIMSYTCTPFRLRSIGDQWFLCTGMSAANNSWGIRANGNHQLHVHVNLHFHLGDLHFIFWLSALGGKKACLHPRWTSRAVPAGLKTAFFCCCSMLACFTETVETATVGKPFFLFLQIVLQLLFWLSVRDIWDWVPLWS